MAAESPYGSADELLRSDQESYFHPFTDLRRHAQFGPHIVTSGQGVRLTDIDGKSHIDGLAGLWCVNVGYGRREIAAAIARQCERLSFYHSFASMGTDVAISLAKRLAEITPIRNSRVLFGNSGSDANDANLKLVRHYNILRGKPEKRKVIVRRRAYHGSTVLTAAASGLPTLHAKFDLPQETFRRVSPACYYWRADKSWSEADYAAHLLSELEATILNEGADTVAAFLAEPISGAGGVLVPPDGYWQGVQDILKRHDVLLLLDEVITGFGRTGNMFAAETYDIAPDIMTVAKGLTSGYVPMSASFISPHIWDVVASGAADGNVFGHGYTYSGHPVAAAAAHASLDIIKNEALVQNAAEQGALLLHLLQTEVAPMQAVGDVRGVGLIACVELDPVWIDAKWSDTTSPASVLARVCMENGVILRPLMNSNIVAIAPPLVVTDADISDIVGVLIKGLKQLAKVV